MYLVKIKNGINEITLDNKYMMNLRVTRTKNKSDSFIFELTNEINEALINPFSTVITVYDEDSVLFKGRIIDIEKDIYNFAIVSCEGVLSYLNDSFYPPYNWQDSPQALLASVLENHNNNVENEKKIYLGSVTVTDPNNYLAVSCDDYTSSLSVLNDKLIDKLGGYLVVRYEDDGTYLDWLTDLLHENTQTIQLGENLIDVNVERSYEDIITRLIPLGAKDEETGKRLDITSVNNGLNYIDNEDGVAAYGIISGVVTWDNVTVADNLLTKAKAIFNTLANGKRTISVKAVDLHMVDLSIEKFHLGDWIKVIIPPHEINGFYQLNQIEYLLDQPENSVIILGDISKTNTSNVRDKVNDIDSVLSQIVNPNKNTLMATKIAGVLNLLNTSLIAQKNAAQRSDVRAILFEDLDKTSSTFGAMCIGTQGIQISKQRNELNTDWVWGTAIDFQTVYADYILTGILSDKLGNFYLDMDKGELRIKDGIFTGKVEGSSFYTSKTTEYTYTEADKTIVQNLIMDETQPTAAQLAKYDLDLNGIITARDYVRLSNILSGKYGATNGKATFVDNIAINLNGSGKIVTERYLNGTRVEYMEFNAGSILKSGDGSIMVNGEPVITEISGTIARFG